MILYKKNVIDKLSEKTGLYKKDIKATYRQTSYYNCIESAIRGRFGTHTHRAKECHNKAVSGIAINGWC